MSLARLLYQLSSDCPLAETRQNLVVIKLRVRERGGLNEKKKKFSDFASIDTSDEI